MHWMGIVPLYAIGGAEQGRLPGMGEENITCIMYGLLFLYLSVAYHIYSKYSI